MNIKDVIELKSASVIHGNMLKYSNYSVGYDNVKTIKYYPELGQVEITKKNGKVNFYNNFSGLYGNESLID